MPYTPGKWTKHAAGFDHAAAFDVYSDGQKWGMVARCESNREGSRFISAEECEANADLVAAAPELREALAALTEWAARMGGFEAQVWDDAAALLERFRS